MGLTRAGVLGFRREGPARAEMTSLTDSLTISSPPPESRIEVPPPERVRNSTCQALRWQGSPDRVVNGMSFM